MSTPQPPPGWPPPPGYPPPGHPPPVRRGKGLTIAGVILLVLAVAGVVLSIVLGARSVLGSIEGFSRVPAATGGEVTITEPGTIAVYLEPAGVLPGGQAVTVTGPDGDTLAFAAPGGDVRYDFNGRSGVLLGTFEAATAGSYTLAGDPGAGSAQFAAGALVTGGILTLVLGIVGSAVMGLVGLILLIVGLVKLSRSRPPRY